jgi:hypothetical protein
MEKDAALTPDNVFYIQVAYLFQGSQEPISDISSFPLSHGVFAHNLPFMHCLPRCDCGNPERCEISSPTEHSP